MMSKGPGSWRWSQRNPVTAASITSALAFLIVALAAATIGYVKTSASLVVAREAQEESEQSFREMQRAVDRFFTHASDHELLDQPGMQPLRQALLQEAVQYYQKFLKQRSDDPAFRDLVLFYEYFDGDTGAGLGASHQTGWTGLVAKLIQQHAEYTLRHRADDAIKDQQFKQG